MLFPVLVTNGPFAFVLIKQENPPASEAIHHAIKDKSISGCHEGTTELHLFLPFDRLGAAVEETLWAREVAGEVFLLPRPDLTALTALFCIDISQYFM